MAEPETLEAVMLERDTLRRQLSHWKGKALWCDKHAVMQPCQHCVDAPVRELARTELERRVQMQGERDGAALRVTILVDTLHGLRRDASPEVQQRIAEVLEEVEPYARTSELLARYAADDPPLSPPPNDPTLVGYWKERYEEEMRHAEAHDMALQAAAQERDAARNARTEALNLIHTVEKERDEARAELVRWRESQTHQNKVTADMLTADAAEIKELRTEVGKLNGSGAYQQTTREANEQCERWKIRVGEAEREIEELRRQRDYEWERRKTAQTHAMQVERERDKWQSAAQTAGAHREVERAKAEDALARLHMIRECVEARAFSAPMDAKTYDAAFRQCEVLMGMALFVRDQTDLTRDRRAHMTVTEAVADAHRDAIP